MNRHPQRRRRPYARGGAVTAAVFAATLLILPGCGSGEAPAGGEPAAAEGPPEAGAPGAGAPQGPPPATVRVGTVVGEELQSRWDVVGRLQEVRRVVVAAEQSGRVLEVPVEEGTPVTGGETVLARIDDVWMRLAQQAAEARLAEAQAAVEATRVRLERYERDLRFLTGLEAAGSANPREVEDARALVLEERARLEQAQAAVESAGVELERARENLARLHVVAPFDGVVVAKLTEVGQWLTPGAPVAEIISRGTIDALIHVPESLVNNLRIGEAVEVRVEPLAIEVPGEVVSINPQAATAARTFPVKVRLQDAEGRLKPGMSVTAHVPTSQRSRTLTVPRDAVQRTAQGTAVWTQVEGAAAPVPVRVLFGQGDRYAIEPVPAGTGATLTEGMPVVIEGGEGLFPGRPLIVLNATQPGTVAAAGGAAPPPAETQ